MGGVFGVGWLSPSLNFIPLPTHSGAVPWLRVSVRTSVGSPLSSQDWGGAIEWKRSLSWSFHPPPFVPIPKCPKQALLCRNQKWAATSPKGRRSRETHQCQEDISLLESAVANPGLARGHIERFRASCNSTPDTAWHSAAPRRGTCLREYGFSQRQGTWQ